MADAGDFDVVVTTVLDAPPPEVWADVEDLGSHVEWMADAERIDFVTDQRSGVGTVMDCETRVGPLRTTDRLEITEWEPGAAMGVRHTGAVTGVGRFTLEPVSGDRTRFTWQERLVFPWWMGGPVGAFVARPVLRAVWRRNLTRLAARFAD